MSRSGRNSSIQNGSNASLETGRGNSTTSGTTNRATTGTRADNSLRMDNIFESRSNGWALSRTGTANQTRTGTIDRNMTGTSLDVRSTDSSSERRGVSVDVRNGVSSQEGSENSFSRSFGTSQNYSNGFRYAETYRQGRRWDHAETMEVFPKLEHRVEAMRKAGDARLALVEARAGAEMLQLIDLESDIVRLMRELDTQSLNMETFKKEAAVSKAKTLKWDDHKDAITKKISSAITAIEIVEDPYHVLVSGVNGQAQVIKGVEGTNVVREERLAIVRESVTKVDVKLVPPLEGLPFRGMKVKIIDPGNGNEFAGTVVRVNEFEETLPRDVQRTSTGVDILFTPNQANPASVSVVVEIDPGQITETKKLRAGETVDAIIEPQTDPKAGEETWPKPVFDFAALAAQQPKPLVPQPLRLKGLAQTADSGLFDRNGNEIDTKNGKLREFSGLTFNYDTKTFFTIDDEAQVVIEFDMNKKFIRTIDVSGLADPKRGPLDLEAIKWITGSHFALLNEGDKNRSAELIIADLSGYMPQRWDARIYELPVRNAESVAFDSDGHLYFATSNVIYKTAKLKENGAGQVFPVTVIEKWDVVNYGWEPIGDIEFVKKNDETPHFYVTTKGDKDKKIAPAVRELAFKSKGKVDLIDSRDIVIRDKFEGLTRFKTSDGADGLAGIAEGPKDGKSKTPYVIGFTMPPGLLGIWLPLVRVFPRVGALVGSLTEATAPALLYIFAPHFGSLLDAEFLPFIWMGVIGLLKSISGFVGIDRYGRFYRGSARDDGADFMFSNMVAWTGLMVFVVQPPTVMGALLVAWILHVVVDVWIVHQKTSFVRALSRIEPEEVIVVPISDEHRQRDMDRLHELKQVISNNESLAHLKDQVLVVYLGNERSMPISIRNVAREYQIVRGSQHDLDAIFKEAQSQILDHESKMYATVSDLADPNGTFGRFAVLDPQHGIFSMSDGLARRHRAIVQFLGVWTLQDSTTSVLNLMMGAKIAESHA